VNTALMIRRDDQKQMLVQYPLSVPITAGEFVKVNIHSELNKFIWENTSDISIDKASQDWRKYTVNVDISVSFRSAEGEVRTSWLGLDTTILAHATYGRRVHKIRQTRSVNC
jgi:hypothetical protein